MKVTFHIRSKELNINDTKSVDFSYEKSGYVCSFIVYGNLKKLESILITENTNFPLAQYLYVLDISWSKHSGFEFNQYNDQTLQSSLSRKFGSLSGHYQIQLGGSLISLNFRSEASAEDLGGSDELLFLESVKKYGIAVKGIVFSDSRRLESLDLSTCQFIDVNFLNCKLNRVKFSGCKLSNVRFIASELDGSDFSKSVFSSVTFESCESMLTCNFQECEVRYSPRRIWDEAILKVIDCNLQGSDFKQSEICAVFENSDLSCVDFSQSKLIACRFYDCKVEKVIFAGVTFASSAEGIRLREQYPDLEKFVCKFGSRKVSVEEKSKRKISNSEFVSASMEGIDLSHNHIVSCNFEDANLRNSSLIHCTIEDCKFQRFTLEAAKCSFMNLSHSSLKKNHFNEVDFYRAIMIQMKDTESEFISSKLGKVNLRGSSFVRSDLTGAFLGEANLTLASFDECKLRGTNFYQTQRSGINLNITEVSQTIDSRDNGSSTSNPGIKSSSDPLTRLQSTCSIGNVQWYSNSNGEVLIDENTFLHIIVGNKSPIAVLANLTKENPNIINIMNQNQASSESRSAGHDQINADTNVDSVNNGDVKGAHVSVNDTLSNDEDDDSGGLSLQREQPIPDDLESNESREDET
jgi:uncharacterized protein YjbI with pentapeptide repeats